MSHLLVGQNDRLNKVDVAQAHRVLLKEVPVGATHQIEAKRPWQDHHVLEAMIGQIRQGPRADAKLDQTSGAGAVPGTQVPIRAKTGIARV